MPLTGGLLTTVIFLPVPKTYAPFAQLKIELPKADATNAVNRANEVLVAVTADGRYAIDRQLVQYTDAASFAELLRRAAQGRSEPLLVINADAQAPHQSVISVMEAARLAGLVRISFATQRVSGGS